MCSLTAASNVADDSDHLRGSENLQRYILANCSMIPQNTLRQHLIDRNNGFATAAVPFGKKAASEEYNAHNTEIVRTGEGHLRHRHPICWRRNRTCPVANPRLIAAHGNTIDNGSRLHSRHSAHMVEDFAPRCARARWIRHGIGPQRSSRDQHFLGIKAGIK